jgi:hypothetical protein
MYGLGRVPVDSVSMGDSLLLQLKPLMRKNGNSQALAF